MNMDPDWIGMEVCTLIDQLKNFNSKWVFVILPVTKH